MVTNAVLPLELRAYPLPGDMALVSPSNDLRNNILLGAAYIYYVFHAVRQADCQVSYCSGNKCIPASTWNEV